MTAADARATMTDHEGRDLVAAETRRTELLIGQMLGPGVQGQHDAHSLASERAVDIPRMDRVRFRQLAEHADAVEAALTGRNRS